MCSDAPDPDPLIGEAARMNAAVARDALDYYKAKDAAQQPRQDRMDALATKLADQQLATSEFNTQQAREQWDRYKNVGIPAEDAMYADAKNYDSQEKIDQAAGEAATDVDTSLAMANDARRRTLARAGVNPADGRSLSMEQEAATQGALAKASAMNGARTRIKDMGIMLRKDAANFAKGMPSNAATTFGVASAAGRDATGAVGGAIQSANSIAQTNGTGFTTAIHGNQSAGSILNQQYSGQLQASKGDDLLSSIGSIGMGLGAMGVKFSDENMKEDIQPVDGDAALEGIKNTDVKGWKYKSGTPADDGGQEHIGAMAQDMQKNLGDTVAPGGKMVDLISAVGVNMAATKALAKKVDKLQKTIAGGVKHG